MSKEKLARFLGGRMKRLPQEQKKDFIEKFKKKIEGTKDYESTLQQMKDMIGYEEN